jgi:hypothetical protein
VIKLRRQIERGLRHPVVGPLLLLALAVLVAFMALHVTSESISGHAELICAALALVLLVALSGGESPQLATRVVATNSSRGPPVASLRLRIPGRDAPDYLPLRL